MKESFLGKFSFFKKAANKLVKKHNTSGYSFAQDALNPSKPPSLNISTIPENKLFISESGYSYNVDDIIKYIHSRNFYDRRIFIDFLNPSKVGGNPLIFSEKDIEKLLDFPEVMSEVYNTFKFIQEELSVQGGEKIKTEDLFAQASECASGIGEETIKLMKEIQQADASLSPLTRNSDEIYFQTMIGPMLKLQEHLNTLEPAELMALRGFMLSMPYNYELARGMMNIRPPNFQKEWHKHKCDLETDLGQQLLNGKCGAGFPQALDMLVCTIETFKNCQKAVDFKASVPIQPSY